jgi:hypothetical protein
LAKRNGSRSKRDPGSVRTVSADRCWSTGVAHDMTSCRTVFKPDFAAMDATDWADTLRAKLCAS